MIPAKRIGQAAGSRQGSMSGQCHELGTGYHEGATCITRGIRPPFRCPPCQAPKNLLAIVKAWRVKRGKKSRG